MEYADKRGSATIGARKSLRAFKQTPNYKALLEGILSRRETTTMTVMEKRRLRLDRVLAGFELEKLKSGEPLSEYAGVMALHDPARGLGLEVDE